MNAFQTLLRRARSTTRLEKAAGGIMQATWAIEAAAGYFERGGTLGGFQFLVGEEGDPDEIQQTYGEDPGPGPFLPRQGPDVGPGRNYLTQEAKDAADHAHLTNPPPWPPYCPVGEEWRPVLAGEQYRLLDSFMYRDQHDVSPEQVRVYRIMNYGQVLADDQEIVGTYYDEQLPEYLVRISEVHAHDGDRQTSSELKALVVERSVLE